MPRGSGLPSSISRTSRSAKPSSSASRETTPGSWRARSRAFRRCSSAGDRMIVRECATRALHSGASRLAGAAAQRAVSIVLDARSARPNLVGVRHRIDVGAAADDTAPLQFGVSAVIHRAFARLLLVFGGPHPADAGAAVIAAAPAGPCRRARYSRKNENRPHQKSLVHHHCPVLKSPRIMLARQKPATHCCRGWRKTALAIGSPRTIEEGRRRLVERPIS